MPELRRRLGMNGDTSHKPPSSDGYREKRLQPALPQEKRTADGRVERKGKTLRMIEKPDRVRPICLGDASFVSEALQRMKRTQ